MEFKNFSLGDLCLVKSSKRIYAKEYVEVGIPFYRSKEIIQLSEGENISTDLFISPERFNELNSKFGSPKIGDILITSVGTIGVPYLVDHENFYFKDGNLTWLSEFDERINNLYIYYWLTSRVGQNEIEKVTIGSTQKALTIVNLKSINIKVPPLKIQNKITEILSLIDNKLQINRESIANLEELSQTLFKRWFVDFEFPDEDGNPYHIHGGKMIQSELGEIPEGWSIGKIDQIGTITGGGTPSRKVAEYYTNKGISWITPKDLSIDKSTFIYKGQNDITELGLKKGSAKLLPEHAVLFSSRAPIGYIAIAGRQVTTNQGFKSIVPDKGFGPYYIYFLLKHKLPSIEQAASGSTFKEISGKGLKNIITLLPNENLVRHFNEIVKVYFDKIKNLELESLYLTELRDTLLPKLMSGEIELPDELEVDQHAELLQ